MNGAEPHAERGNNGTRKSSVWFACAWLATVIVGVPAARSQQTEPPKESPVPQSDPQRSAWLHEIYLGEASGYEFYIDDQGREKLELRREPAMRWTSGGDYNGEVYVWTHRGSAAIVGCIFSGPQG